MTTITQDMRYRLSLIRFAKKHGVSKAAISDSISHTFYSFDDFSKQLNFYHRRYYKLFTMRPLERKSSDAVLKGFIHRGVTYV